MSDRRSGFGDFLTGLLVGGAIAYIVGLLNAPRPGDETRQMWTEKGRELRDQAMGTIQDTVDKTEKMVSENRGKMGSSVSSIKDRVQERVSDLKNRGEAVVTNTREQVSSNLRDAADQVDPNQPPNAETPPGPQI